MQINLFGVAKSEIEITKRLSLQVCVCVWHEESQFVVLHSKFHGAFLLSGLFLQVHFNDLFYSMKIYLWRAAADSFFAD